MRYPNKLLIAAVSVAAVACGGTDVVDEPAADVTSEARVKPSPWTFTKLPATWQARYVTSPAQGLDAMAFEMAVNGAKATTVKRMAFMFTGTLQAGEVTNLQLAYFPNGLAKPGTIVGSNSGATWAPGPYTSILSIDLTSPITLWQNYKAQFVLRVDVNGTRTFFFSPQLQTVTIEVGGVQQYLTTGTCDLPLPGDTFFVN